MEWLREKPLVCFGVVELSIICSCHVHLMWQPLCPQAMPFNHFSFHKPIWTHEWRCAWTIFCFSWQWPVHVLSTYVIRQKAFLLADMLEELLDSPSVNTVNKRKSSMFEGTPCSRCHFLMLLTNFGKLAEPIKQRPSHT